MLARGASAADIIKEVDEDHETRKAKAKNLKRANDGRINKHMYSKNEPLLISDIIFQMV